jgi:glutathione S-transferase
MPSDSTSQDATGIPTLYYRPGACALAPHILLHWVGAEHVAKRAERNDSDLLAINPSGAVPAFRTADGRGLTQAAAIMQHIALQARRGDLLGADDATTRDEVGVWLSFFTGDFHPSFWPYFVPMMYISGATKEQYPAVKEAGIKLVQNGLAKIDAHLAGRETFVGGAKTAVDAYAVPILRWARNIAGVDFAAYANAARFYGAITTDPGVVAAMKHQGIEP